MSYASANKCSTHKTGMSKKQRQVMLAVNTFALVYLMYFITQVTKAYIGISYSDVPKAAVDSLLTVPNMVGLVVSFIVGPLSLKRSKVRLASAAMMCVFIYCMIFYFTGRFHAPFVCLYIGCVFAGCAQGTYAVMLNSIISAHFPGEERSDRIANYNVALNIGAVIILRLAGKIAAGHGGADWYDAYLLGFASFAGLIVFMYMSAKADADIPSVRNTEAAEQTGEASMRDIPLKVFGWVVLMGLGHGLFYISQYAFNINISSYVITEYSLGTSDQAGTATSLVRFSLVICTAIYPLFKRILGKWMIPTGYMLVGAGLGVMICMRSLTGAYMCACIIGLGTSLAHATLFAQASRFVPVQLVPVAMSFTWGVANTGSSSAVFVLNFISGLLGGGVENNLLAGVISAGAATIAAIYMYVLRKPLQHAD